MLKLNSETVGEFVYQRQILERFLETGFLPPRSGVYFEGEYIDLISTAHVLYNAGIITKEEWHLIDSDYEAKSAYKKGLITEEECRRWITKNKEKSQKVRQEVTNSIREALQKICSGCCPCGAEGMCNGHGCGQIRRMTAKNRVRVNGDSWYALHSGVPLSSVQGYFGFNTYPIQNIEVPELCLKHFARLNGVSYEDFIKIISA